MGKLYDASYEKAVKLWHAAHKLNKPVSGDLSWTYGIIAGRRDFLDLQTYAVLLASSIIVTEPVVPRIICSWDNPLSYSRRYHDRKFYPTMFMHLFDGYNPKILERNQTKFTECSHLTSKYVSLNRAGYSCNVWPRSLGLGYRAKYLAAQLPLTQHFILSDADLINTGSIVPQLLENVKAHPDTFCWTGYAGPDPENSLKLTLSVGLCVYNTAKFRTEFWPRLNQIFWECLPQDSQFIPAVLERFPESKEKLDLKTFDHSLINTLRFRPHRLFGRWQDDKSLNYHAWCGETRNAQFMDFFGGQIDKLQTMADAQLAAQEKQ